MRVQWLVPGLPATAFQAGTHDLHFSGTVGWCWEEAAWAGQHTGPGDQLVIGADIEMPDAVVVSPEGYATQYVPLLLNAPKDVALFLRCVGAPSLNCGVPTGEAPNSTWKSLEPVVPRLKGIAALSEVEKGPLEKWAREHGFNGEVSVIPLGAEVLTPTGQVRRGVAFLGRPFVVEKGIDLLIEAAKRLPHIPFYFATPRGTELGLGIGLRKKLESVPNAVATTCGIRGRAALLQQVRIVAVRGLTDWQWLPGTEIRAAHGVALAEAGTPTEAWNGPGLAYFRDLDRLVDLIHTLHEDDVVYRAEADRQHAAFLAAGLDSGTVGRKLWEWVHG